MNLTSIIYLRNEAIKKESRTSTNNKDILVVYGSKSYGKISYNYSLITFLLEKGENSRSVIKIALKNYQPINPLEYE